MRDHHLIFFHTWGQYLRSLMPFSKISKKHWIIDHNTNASQVSTVWKREQKQKSLMNSSWIICPYSCYLWNSMLPQHSFLVFLYIKHTHCKNGPAKLKIQMVEGRRFQIQKEILHSVKNNQWWKNNLSLQNYLQYLNYPSKRSHIHKIA